MRASQVFPPGYTVVQPLRGGEFGKVFRVRGPGGVECAFKVLPMSRDALKEFRTLRLIRGIRPHRNLLECQGVWLRTAAGKFLDKLDDLSHRDPWELEGMDLLVRMPLAEGSLADKLKAIQPPRGRAPVGLPVADLLRYMAGAASGLDHLHAPVHDLGTGGPRRIIHRDVKPANLLLAKGEVVVADYGVARIRTDSRGDSPTLQIGCSPAYAAPEVYADDAVPASDQYSLAITYYELRTGRLPFAGDAIQAHIFGKLDFSLVPPAEQKVLRRATDRKIRHRYPSCSAFVEALRVAVLGLPAEEAFDLPEDDSSPAGLPTVRSEGRYTGTAADSNLSPYADTAPFDYGPEADSTPEAEEGVATEWASASASGSGPEPEPEPEPEPVPEPEPERRSQRRSVRVPPPVTSMSPAGPAPRPKRVNRIVLHTRDGTELEITERAVVGQAQLARFGPDTACAADEQFVLDRADGGWVVEPVVGTPNDTMLNGDLLIGWATLTTGDKIGVGRPGSPKPAFEVKVLIDPGE